MKYLPMKHKTINLKPKEQIEIDAASGMVLVPEDGTKVFLHWKNESGKLISTYTMTFPTKVEGSITMINALDKESKIKVVW